MKISGSRRIAERYVKALFEVAEAASALADVEKDLQALGKALAQSDDFRHFLNNPLLSHNDRAGVMLAILDKMQVNQLTRQFIGMLIHQKRLAILSDIIDLFGEWAERVRGELRGEVIAATALKPQEIKQVNDSLSKAYGRKMNLQIKQDPSLLGGVIVKVGSQQLDASLAGKLNRLKIALQAA